MFLSDWYSETDEVLTDEIDLFDVETGPGDLDCQIVPSGPGFEFENNLRLFLGLLYYAQQKIIIVSPYFVPDEALLLAITTACHRGLEVELFVSEEGDQAVVYHAQRSYYEVLLRAGVKIWMYPRPYILHAKSMTIDDEIGDHRLEQHGHALVRSQHGDLDAGARRGVRRARCATWRTGYRELSRELTLEEWEKQPLRSTVLDNLARSPRLFSEFAAPRDAVVTEPLSTRGPDTP